MQLGKSLLGAIVGAAVGIGLLLAVYLLLGLDKVWLVIPFAVVTGLGVRMFASTAGHASYVRGAMTMLIALAGYIGGWYLVEKVMTARANAQGPKSPAAVAAAENPAGESAEAAAKDTEAAEPKDEAAPAEQPKAVPPPAEKPQPRPAAGKSLGSTWDVIWLAIAALVAYEMGRGSGVATKPVESGPAGTHPDA